MSPRPQRLLPGDAASHAGRDPLGLEGVWNLIGLGEAWHRKARCGGGRVDADYDPWFAQPTSSARAGYSYTADASDGSLHGQQLQAVATCALCPVMRECLLSSLEPAPVSREIKEHATLRGAEYGIFAGLTGKERMGKTSADVDDLLAFSRSRAVREGLAPHDVLVPA